MKNMIIGFHAVAAPARLLAALAALAIAAALVAQSPVHPPTSLPQPLSAA